MSQPRRRRRRRRGKPSGEQQPAVPERSVRSSSESHSSSGARSAGTRRGRRRGRGRGSQTGTPSPKSSEDLVRGPARPVPDVLTGPPDGTTLEQLIGELQSDWGVPQSPQEFRITLKVAEERQSRGVGVAEVEELREESEPGSEAAGDTPGDEQPRREKAPAAPRLGNEGDAPAGDRPISRRRKRSRRRRRGGKSDS